MSSTGALIDSAAFSGLTCVDVERAAVLGQRDRFLDDASGQEERRPLTRHGPKVGEDLRRDNAGDTAVQRRLLKRHGRPE